MSKAEREAFYAQPALPFEKEYECEPDDLDRDILLPLTRAGFENLLTSVCKVFALPADDGSRSTLAGYIHHIAPDKHTTTISELGMVLHKAISNSMTWQVDQDVKAKRQAEEKPKQEEPTLNLVGSSDGTSPKGS